MFKRTTFLIGALCLLILANVLMMSYASPVFSARAEGFAGYMARRPDAGYVEGYTTESERYAAEVQKLRTPGFIEKERSDYEKAVKKLVVALRKAEAVGNQAESVKKIGEINYMVHVRMQRDMMATGQLDKIKNDISAANKAANRVRALEIAWSPLNEARAIEFTRVMNLVPGGPGPSNSSGPRPTRGPLAALARSTQAVQGFADYTPAGAKDSYQPMGAFDGVRLETGNANSWRYTKPDEPLNGYFPKFTPGPDNLFMFKDNQCKPECCGASFSCNGGCVCTTQDQKDYLNMRGGNRTAPDAGV